MTLFEKKSLKLLLLICGIIAFGKITAGYGIILLAVMGCVYSFSPKQRDKALFCFVLLAASNVVNPIVLPHPGAIGLAIRFTYMIMPVAFMISSGAFPGNHKIPLGGLFTFLAVAGLTSAQGYFPMISYLKILNCVLFFAGLYFGTLNLQNNLKQLEFLRHFMFAICLFFILGSIASLAFPSIAYYVNLKGAVKDGGMEYASSVYANIKYNSGMTLFCGISYQSQMLAIILPCLNALVLLDMVLIEKKLSRLHLIMLAAIPAMVYMTRSRIAFLVYVVSILSSYFFALRFSDIPERLKRQMKLAIIAMGILIFTAGIVMEVRNRTITMWLRKTNTVEVDDRSFSEAFTESRMGLVEMLMEDFASSPFLGSGFQVTKYMPEAYKYGRISLFSAPLEKGVTPVMVLAETGILGAIFFLVFLVSFTLQCINKRYAATLTMFICFFVSNLAESTFFSPSGGGGFVWGVCIIGGFVLDSMLLVERRTVQYRTF